MNVQEKLLTLLEYPAIRERFAYQQEKWVTNGDNVCPMCADLQSLGWLPLGTLPRYKHAHSELGEGKWKAPDSSCQCTKAYKRSSGDNPGPKILVFVPGYGWTAVDSSFGAEGVKIALTKVKTILEKYKGVCTCS